MPAKDDILKYIGSLDDMGSITMLNKRFNEIRGGSYELRRKLVEAMYGIMRVNTSMTSMFIKFFQSDQPLIPIFTNTFPIDQFQREVEPNYLNDEDPFVHDVYRALVKCLTVDPSYERLYDNMW